MSTMRNAKEEIMKLCGRNDHAGLAQLLQRSSFSNEVFGRAWRHVIEHEHQECFDVLLNNIKRGNNPSAICNNAIMDCVHFNKAQFLEQILTARPSIDQDNLIYVFTHTLGSEDGHECGLIVLPHIQVLKEDKLSRALQCARDNPNLKKFPKFPELITGMIDRKDPQINPIKLLTTHIGGMYALYSKLDFCILIATHPDFEPVLQECFVAIDKDIANLAQKHTDDIHDIVRENFQCLKAACSKASLLRHNLSNEKSERHGRRI